MEYASLPNIFSQVIIGSFRSCFYHRLSSQPTTINTALIIEHDTPPQWSMDAISMFPTEV
jgi:hypothetical protein